MFISICVFDRPCLLSNCVRACTIEFCIDTLRCLCVCVCLYTHVFMRVCACVCVCVCLCMHLCIDEISRMCIHPHFWVSHEQYHIYHPLFSPSQPLPYTHSFPSSVLTRRNQRKRWRRSNFPPHFHKLWRSEFHCTTTPRPLLSSMQYFLYCLSTQRMENI